MRIHKEPSELSQYEKMRGDFKVLWPIVKDALSKKHWLYHKHNREWFTPEEFLNLYQKKEMNNYEVQFLKDNLIIRDPEDGNTAYHKEIERKTQQHEKEISELRSKGQAFLNKVIHYYQSKLSQR